MFQYFKQRMLRAHIVFKHITLGVLLGVIGFIPFAHTKHKKEAFQTTTQQIPNFGDIKLISNGNLLKNDNKLLICGYNNNVRIFNPATGAFEGDAFILPPCNFSFPNASVIIPPDPSRNIVGGFACTSFLDGRIWTILNDATVVQSNLGTFTSSPVTGPVNAFSFNPTLAVNPEFGINGIQGAQPMYYRKSNDRLYTQSGLDPSQIFMLDWRGSVPAATPLSIPVVLNTGVFLADDKLYAPDYAGNQIVKIDVDSGLVTTVTNNIPAPIALDVDHNGIFYVASRSTGNIYTYNNATNTLTILATLDAALSGLALNADQTKVYASNDLSSIYEVEIRTGAVKVLFSSALVGPWDLGFDASSNSLYVADNGSLKEFNVKTGALQRILVLDSSANPAYNGFGLANGVSIDKTTLIITDITLGNILVVNIKDFSFHDVFTFFDPVVGPFIFGKQPFSAIRVVGGPVGEYYLCVNPVDGLIVKIFPSASGLQPQIFFSGLKSPVKLKLHSEGYIYVVEAGEVINEIPNTGRVSRIKLVDNPTPEDRVVLVDHLNQPEGFDISEEENTLYIYETNNSRILSASASIPTSNPQVVVKKLAVEDEGLFYQFAPLRIHPLAGLATDGKNVYFSETQTYQISKIKV